MRNKSEVKQVKEIVKRILKENSCIVVTSEGLTILAGDYKNTIRSVAFMLYNLFYKENNVYNDIMKEFDVLKKEHPCKENKKKDANK